jgi:hypothetical protein
MERIKKQHIAHIIGIILIAFYGLYCLGSISPEELKITASAYYDLREEFTIKYGIAAILFFGYTTWLGYKTYLGMRKIGGLLLLGGFGFSIWNVFMLSQPRSLGVDEVFPAHFVWFIIAIILDIIVLARWGKKSSRWKQDILDAEQEYV